MSSARGRPRAGSRSTPTRSSPTASPRWRELLPGPLAHLEGVAPHTGFACGELSIADIAVASAFTNARYAGFVPDASAYPRLRAWLGRAWATPAFAARLARDRADYGRLLA